MKITLKVNKKVDKEQTIEHVKRVLFNSMLKLHELAVRNAPVDTGRLRNSIKLIPMSPGYSKYTLRDGVSYGSDVEYGTSPHYVSAESLKGWSRRVLKDSNAAYAVASKIARKGTEAQPFFRPALSQVRDIWVKRYFEQTFK